MASPEWTLACSEAVQLDADVYDRSATFQNSRDAKNSPAASAPSTAMNHGAFAPRITSAGNFFVTAISVISSRARPARRAAF